MLGLRLLGEGCDAFSCSGSVQSGSLPPAAAQALAMESSLFTHKRSVEQAERCLPADSDDENRLFSEKGISK